MGIGLPLAELAVAVLLLPEATAWWGALGALALLLLFCLAIGVNLARGRQPDCHCFGQLHSEPAGPSTLLRNGALAAVALLVVVAGVDDAGPGALEWIGELDAAEAIALGASAVAILAVLGAAGWRCACCARTAGCSCASTSWRRAWPPPGSTCRRSRASWARWSASRPPRSRCRRSTARP